MENEILEFESEGFPIIKVSKDNFEIKGRNHSDFKVFQYADLIEIKISDPHDNWWSKLMLAGWTFGTMMARNDPFDLKIIYRNGGEWSYKIPPKRNPEFLAIIHDLDNRVKRNNKAKSD